jgi:hypothetical protein
MALNTLLGPGQPSNYCAAQALLQPSGSQVGLELSESQIIFESIYALHSLEFSVQTRIT